MIARAALVALLAAPLAAMSAQGRWEGDNRDRRTARDRDVAQRLFTWRGTVDDETRIHIRAGSVESQVVRGARARSRGSVDRDNPLPRREGVVRVRLLEGRGRVQVIQQPTARNNYTAIVRVKDAQPGAGRYRFAAVFEPADGGRRVDRGRGGSGGVWTDVGGDVNLGDRAFRWSGSVDNDLRIVLRQGSVRYDVVSGEQPRAVSSSGANQMLRRGGQLGVSLRQGRGAVSVIQQPSASNSYTAIIRVLDRQGGYGYYDFDLIWR